MSVNDQITKMNAGWYNVVVGALDLDPTNFQLAQGTLGLQTNDSSGLFLMSDAVPPSAAVHYFDSSGLSKRSSAYGALLNALMPEQASTLPQVLGDMYSNWITFKASFYKDNPTSDKTQVEVFEIWANRTLDPSKAGQAITVYKQAANNKLNQALDDLHAKAAQQTFTAPDQTQFSLYRYTATNSGANNAIATGGGPVSIDYNSSTANSTLKQTTAQGSASGFWDIFSGGAGASFDKLNTTAAASEFSVTGTIGKFATLATAPIAWFDSFEFERAFHGKGDAGIWNPVANLGDWNSFFSQPSGSLSRRVSQLILVSDYELTVTSHASYSSEDYQQITTQASFGIWPFFSAQASATNTSDYKHNENGTLSVTHRLGKGLIQIWGVNVQEAPN